LVGIGLLIALISCWLAPSVCGIGLVLNTYTEWWNNIIIIPSVWVLPFAAFPMAYSREVVLVIFQHLFGFILTSNFKCFPVDVASLLFLSNYYV
jgi:hypothetical protein